MKKTMVALAASLCALSAHAADPIDFNVQLKGEVPSQDYFDVTVRGGWNPDDVSIKLPEGWDGKWTDKLHELQWDVRSSYGAVKVKVGTPGQEFSLENSSGEALRLSYNITSKTGGWNGWVSKGGEFGGLKADAAKKGDWIGLRFALKNDNGAPASGEYVGTLPVVFETGFEG